MLSVVMCRENSSLQQPSSVRFALTSARLAPMSGVPALQPPPAQRLFDASIRNGIKKGLIILHDLAVTALAVVASLALRFDDAQLAERMGYAWLLLPFAAYAGCVYAVIRLYESKWRFASLPDLMNIAKASLALALTLLVVDYVAVAPDMYGGYFFGRQAIIIYLFVQMAFLGGPRLVYRYWKDRRTKAVAGGKTAPRTLILGRSGDVEVLLRGIESGVIRNIRAEGILSPRENDLKQTIRGVRVLGLLTDFEREMDAANDREAPIMRVVMTPGALVPEAHPETILDRARRRGVPVLRLQNMDGSSGGQLAPVEIEDLLLRPTHDIDADRVRGFVAGRRTVVTGGGGSIGGELCRRLVSFGAASVTVLESSEPALHAILEELATLDGATAISGHIADVRDRARLDQLFAELAPDIVFHAAALKHVPYLEQDWTEGVKTNVFGSVNAARAAVAAKVACFVMISTDKAIQPVSMLGATKRFAEMATEALDSEQAGTRLIAVRFGNVLGSNGSVVPKFKQQIARGGPITVTHPDMIRYFMTVEEACDLVLTAASHAGAKRPSGDAASVYVLKMGQPVKIMELATRMIQLSGLRPGVDIEIQVTGARPGERLHEILFDADEPMVETGLDGIMAAKTRVVTVAEIEGWLARLSAAVAAGDEAATEAILAGAIPEFRRAPQPRPT
jgi:FlaA1/EpsC-like NDP-sugar epimerase